MVTTNGSDGLWHVPFSDYGTLAVFFNGSTNLFLFTSPELLATGLKCLIYPKI